MSRDVALLNEMTAAINAADARRYAAVYEPDARVVIHGNGALTGRPAIEQYERELFAQFPSTRFAIANIWTTPLGTIARYGVNSPPSSKMPATGHEGLLFYDMSPGGLIAEEHRYLDSLTPAVQAGAFPTLAARPIPTLAAAPIVFDTPTRGVGNARVDGSGLSAALLARLDSAMIVRDVDTFACCFADGGEIDDFSRPRPDAAVGAIRSWFTAWCGAFDNVTIKPVRTISLGDVAFSEDVIHATMTDAWSGVGGRERATRAVSLHRARIAYVENGQIVRLSQFVNRRELQS
jgi:hypothetical protein